MDNVEVAVTDDVVGTEKDNNVIEIYSGDETEPWTSIVLTDAEWEMLETAAKEQEITMEKLLIKILENAVAEAERTKENN